ncbi:hypothetical protein ACVW16_000399 [Bradyrhizobium sp. USDA 4474]
MFFGVVLDSQAACRRGPWFVVVSQGDHRMNQCLRSLACVVAVAALALLPAELAAKSGHKSSASKKTHEAKAGKPRHAAGSRHGKHAEAKRKSKKPEVEPADKPAPPALTGDLAALKDAIDLARKGKTKRR